MLGVCYFPKIWLLLQHLTNCSGWSICSEIPWSISAGIGGQFIPNSGGQYHRNLHCLWVLHQHWPFLGEYAAEHFERNFKSLLSWQKVGVYLGFFLALLYAFVIALGTVL